MNLDKQPNPKIHLYLSLVKSAIRIAAGIAFIYQLVFVAGLCLIAAELLGILEELF